MPFEHITVLAGGYKGREYAQVYDGWETVVIEIDINVAYVNVLLTTTEITPIGADTRSAFDKWNFPPGTPIEVYANGELVVAAVVWQYVPSADATQHSITLYARTHSNSFVISSVIAEHGGSYENMTLLQIIGEWAQAHGVTIFEFGAGQMVPFFQIRQGASSYEEALRLLKPYGRLLFGLTNGGLAISDGSALGAQGPIVQGENILRMSARLTDGQFEQNLTIGQQNIGTSLEEHIQAHGDAGTTPRISELGARLAKVIVEPALINRDRALQRSDWERRRAEGATTEATLVVPGWHAPAGVHYVQENRPVGETPSPAGPLWIHMADTYVFAPWLKINCVMRAVRIVFKQSIAEGSTTEITVQDPVATLGITGAPCENGTAWGPTFVPSQYMPGFLYEPFEEWSNYYSGRGMGNFPRRPGGIGHQ